MLNVVEKVTVLCPWRRPLKEMYHEGHGTKINKRRAGRWWLKAAQQGRKEAQYNVAMMYQFGALSITVNLLWKATNRVVEMFLMYLSTAFCS